MTSQIQRHWLHPHNRGIPSGSSISGQVGTPGEGPYLQLKLDWEGGVIQTARFQTYNCPIAIACGSWLVTWIEGKTVAQVSALNPNDLVLLLGGLPPGKAHCAELAVGALQSAVEHFLNETRG